MEEGGGDLVVHLTELPDLLLVALVSVVVGDVVGDGLLPEHRVLRNINKRVSEYFLTVIFRFLDS